MTTLRSILLASTALATLAPPAHAASEMLRETTVESWQIQSWSRNDGPGFSFCTAHTAYINGTYLYFQLQPSGVSGLLVALYNRNWELDPWQNYDVAIRVDGNPAFNVKRSLVTSTQTARFALSNEDATVFLKQLFTGHVLHIKQFNFPLTDVDKMLPAFYNCVKTEMGWTDPAVADPFKQKGTQKTGDMF